MSYRSDVAYDKIDLGQREPEHCGSNFIVNESDNSQPSKNLVHPLALPPAETKNLNSVVLTLLTDTAHANVGSYPVTKTRPDGGT